VSEGLRQRHRVERPTKNVCWRFNEFYLFSFEEMGVLFLIRKEATAH